jgi:ABC-type amino acid transport substrate-binding protein
VNQGIRALHENGTIDAIEDTWLSDGGSIPSLTN